MGAIIAQEVIELKDVTQSDKEKRAPDGGYGWFIVGKFKFLLVIRNNFLIFLS